MIVLKILALFVALFVLYVLFLVVCSLLVNPKKEYQEHSGFYRALLNGATAVAMKVMRIRIHTEGIEKLPPDTRKLLFVCNHRSNFDPIITWKVLKKWQPAFVSKASNFKIPIFGRLIRKCCFMVIDRENPREALKTFNKAAKLLENGEVSVAIYPEGTRSKACRLLPFHNSVFKVAQMANAPIAVLTIEGTEQVHKHYPLHHTDVYLKVLEVIPADKVKSCRTNAIGERIRGSMERQLNGAECTPHPC